MTTILFDLDGTLTDPALGIVRSMAYALTEMGQTPPSHAELQRYIGPPLRTTFATLLDTEDSAEIETAVAHYRHRFADVGLYENEVFAGIGDLLDTLNDEGHTLYVATSKPQVYAERIVSHFGLDHAFAKVYGCELDGTRANKADLILYLLLQEKVDAAECVMIGDREHDILGARANGVAGVGVTWGYGSAEELHAAGAVTVVETVGDLGRVLMAQPIFS